MNYYLHCAIEFQCPYPVPPANRTVHIFCHYAQKDEHQIRMYLHNYMKSRQSYVEKVGAHILEKLDLSADQYAEKIKDDDTPMDLLSVFMFAHLYRIHIAVIIHGAVWTTSKLNDVRLSKFILIYRGFNNFVETCRHNSAELYLDSLLLNTKHGKMPCHKFIEKLDPEEDQDTQQPVDLSQQNSIASTSGVVKSELKKETSKISSITVLHVSKPKNRQKTAQYNTALKILLKAKFEEKNKAGRLITAGKIKQHIQSVPFNPIEVAQHARERRNHMISTVCEFLQCRMQVSEGVRQTQNRISSI